MSHSDSEVNRTMKGVRNSFHIGGKTKRRKIKALPWKSKLLFKETRLLRAISLNNTDLVEEQLRLGTMANCIDDHGRTALHIAASKGYTDIVKLLLAYGADPNKNDKLLNTPLHLAACTHNLQIISLLINAGADVGKLDLYGKNPLQLAQSKLQLLQRSWRAGSIEMIQVQKELQLIVDIFVTVLSRQRGQARVEGLEFMKLSLTEDTIDDQMSKLLTELQGFQISQ